jgi:hypothetical protein
MGGILYHEKRWMCMKENPLGISEKLFSEGQKTKTFLLSLTECEWETDVYFDAAIWKVRDVIAHFISAEKSFLILFENIRNYNQGAPANFDINEFNNSQVEKLKQFSTKELTSWFMDTRDETISWVNKLSESDLDKTGHHPAMGDARLRDMLKMVYLHNQIHLKEVRSALKLIVTN